MTEFKPLSLVLRCRQAATIFHPNHISHLLRIISSFYTEGAFIWSQANVEQIESIKRSCLKDI